MENSVKYMGLKVLCVNLCIATCCEGLQSRAIALNLSHVCISILNVLVVHANNVTE